MFICLNILYRLPSIIYCRHSCNSSQIGQYSDRLRVSLVEKSCSFVVW